MFENEKIYITEIKTVSLNENKVGKKTYSSPGVFFGMSASVYGKMTNCFFGGTFSQKSYAVSQAYKTPGPMGCFYDGSRVESYNVPGATAFDRITPDAAKMLNDGRNSVKELLGNTRLSEWTISNGQLCFEKNDILTYYEKGDGSKEKPYIIKSADDFMEFTNQLNNRVTFKNKYFLQVADIDLSKRTDYAGASGVRIPFLFEGFYDGQGHTINIALDIADKSCNNTVFPNTNGVIVNLGITGTISSDCQYVSGFVRSIRPEGIVANCYSLVNISTRQPVESCYELRYNISGRSKIRFDEQTYDIGEGSVLYIPRKTATTTFSEEIVKPSKSISIYFDTQFSLPEEMFVCHMTENKEMELLFSRMYTIWLGRKSKYYLECMSLIYEIISKLSKPKGNYLSKDKYSIIADGVSYIYENCFNKDIDVYYPAQLCGISYTYFKQLFIQKFDRAPKQHIIYIRMERAAELLKTTNQTVTEIAESCGFENVYYFSMAFKKHFGVSPKNYIK